MAGGSKPSLFGRIANVVGDVVGDHLVKLPASIRDHVQVDAANKRFFLSHEVFTAAVRAAASQSNTFEIVELRPLPDAHHLTAQVRGRDVVARFRIESITWADGQVVVKLSVPEGVEITSSLVLNFIAAGVCKIFGGTSVGEAILSAPLPPNVRWDGQTVQWITQISPTHVMPKWIRTAEPLVLTVAHERRGIWFSIDVTASIFLWLVTYVGKLVARWR